MNFKWEPTLENLIKCKKSRILSLHHQCARCRAQYGFCGAAKMFSKTISKSRKLSIVETLDLEEKLHKWITKQIQKRIIDEETKQN